MEDEQQLFLIEFLVEKVNIPVIRAVHEELLPATTCVSFQILSLPPINIYQESLVDGCGCKEGDTQVFKKGKSCLFALPTIVLLKPLTNFPINVSIYKKLPPGVLPDVMLIGSTQVEAKDLINSLLRQQAFKTLNPSKALKEIYTITTATGQCVGSITLFVRASCFGKKIVTQFQIPHNRKPYLFKGGEHSPVFQCKKIPSECLVPAPLRCTCKPTKCNDGSGEAAIRTCCPTPTIQPEIVDTSTDKYKQPDWGPRPCCPSLQFSPGQGKQAARSPPSTVQTQRDQQVTSSGNCPPCCTPQQMCPDAVGKCTPCCTSKPVCPDAVGKCMPCCAPKPTCPNAVEKCMPCCTPNIQKDSCPPCCGASSSPIASKGYKAFSDLFGKEPAVKKCGCAVKEYNCNCSGKK